MIKVYADFNHKDEQDRIILDTIGSIDDLDKYQGVITEGMDVLLYMEDEFEVRGTLVFDKVWMAHVDMSSIRYINPEDGLSPIGWGEERTPTQQW